VYKKEPPPKEILEDLTAKGGDLLSRTTQNFRPPQKYDQLPNGHDTEGSDDDSRRTPRTERVDGDEPHSGERRVRGLFEFFFSLLRLGFNFLTRATTSSSSAGTFST
jgi:chromatin structure-remodeling complex subunit RSC9